MRQRWGWLGAVLLTLSCGDSGGGGEDDTGTDTSTTGMTMTAATSVAPTSQTGTGTSSGTAATATTEPPTSGTDTGTTMSTVDDSSSSTGGGGRVTDGLVVLYLFDEGAGTTIADQSGADPAIDLTIQGGASVTWAATGLTIDESSVILAEDSTDKLFDAITTTETITVEAWVTSSDTAQEGPGRIFAFTGGTQSHNFLLGQGHFNDPAPDFSWRMRTADTNDMGIPELTGVDAVDTAMHQVLVTRDDAGDEVMYLDGAEFTTGARTGDLGNWEQGQDVVVGNAADGSRPWLGELHLVAVYDRALTRDEAQQNFDAGL